MECPEPPVDHVGQALDVSDVRKALQGFYDRHFGESSDGVVRISLEMLKGLKESGITTEQFLEYVCQRRGALLHGTVREIAGDSLAPRDGKVFAAKNPAIAIMRSIYSNTNVNLKYPYFIGKDHPLKLEIHTPPDKSFVSVDKGFVYVVDAPGFRNVPEGSWQFVREGEDVRVHAVVETERDDFNYPVEVFNDLGSEQEG